MFAPIYAKTDKGRKEISGRACGLSAKARRVLILVDAQKTEADLSSATGFGEEIKSLLKLLIDSGLIMSCSAQSNPASTRPVPILAESVSPPQSAEPRSKRTDYPSEDIARVKQIILDSTDEYLGLLGIDIKRRLEVSNDFKTIINCVARWNLAMRENKLAKPVAAYYLQQVQTILD